MTRRLLRLALALGIAWGSVGCDNEKTAPTVPKFEETKTPSASQPAKKSPSKNGFE